MLLSELYLFPLYQKVKHVSPSGTMEKDIVLRAAKIISKVLNKTGKFKVYLTRNSDKRVPLRVRFKIAQKHRAGVFFSIHADSIKGSKARGVALYTLSTKGSNREASLLEPLVDNV